MAHSSSSSSGDSPVSVSLRNGLILQEIFSFLPLRSLLTSSQVNKFWKAEARTYIRDHRKCPVFISSSTMLPCTQQEQLDQDVARMTIVPFNSLQIMIRPHTEPESGNDCPNRRGHQANLVGNLNKSGYENLVSKLKLKHLWISWHEEVMACHVSSLISRLLAEKASELKSLKFPTHFTSANEPLFGDESS